MYARGTPAARLPTRFEMDMRFDAVYYEPRAPEYPLGRELREKYSDLPWIEIESHNKIPQFSGAENRAFPALKKHLIVGVRKTHKYVENRKVSDFLVPYTSSGCRAMCLYCYLVCNYNKCAYLRLFVNREQMMGRLIKTSLDASRPLTFEIGSNSDLVMENAVTGNLPLTIESFGREGRGKITFPTKSDMVEPLLALDHKGKTIFRMSVNPDEIIRRYEIGTSPLLRRISALNDMCAAGYPVGLIIAPVILLPEWRRLYGGLIDTLAQGLSPAVRRTGFIEVIFMTYSFVHNAINREAFPRLPPLFDPRRMTVRGRGKYCYRKDLRAEAEVFLRKELDGKLGMPVVYVV